MSHNPAAGGPGEPVSSGRDTLATCWSRSSSGAGERLPPTVAGSSNATAQTSLVVAPHRNSRVNDVDPYPSRSADSSAIQASETQQASERAQVEPSNVGVNVSHSEGVSGEERRGAGYRLTAASAQYQSALATYARAQIARHSDPCGHPCTGSSSDGGSNSSRGGADAEAWPVSRKRHTAGVQRRLAATVAELLHVKAQLSHEKEQMEEVRRQLLQRDQVIHSLTVQGEEASEQLFQLRRVADEQKREAQRVGLRNCELKAELEALCQQLQDQLHCIGSQREELARLQASRSDVQRGLEEVSQRCRAVEREHQQATDRYAEMERAYKELSVLSKRVSEQTAVFASRSEHEMQRIASAIERLVAIALDRPTGTEGTATRQEEVDRDAQLYDAELALVLLGGHSEDDRGDGRDGSSANVPSVDRGRESTPQPSLRRHFLPLHAALKQLRRLLSSHREEKQALWQEHRLLLTRAGGMQQEINALSREVDELRDRNLRAEAARLDASNRLQEVQRDHTQCAQLAQSARHRLAELLHCSSDDWHAVELALSRVQGELNRAQQQQRETQAAADRQRASYQEELGDLRASMRHQVASAEQRHAQAMQEIEMLRRTELQWKREAEAGQAAFAAAQTQQRELQGRYDDLQRRVSVDLAPQLEAQKGLLAQYESEMRDLRGENEALRRGMVLHQVACDDRSRSASVPPQPDMVNTPAAPPRHGDDGGPVASGCRRNTPGWSEKSGAGRHGDNGPSEAASSPVDAPGVRSRLSIFEALVFVLRVYSGLWQDYSDVLGERKALWRYLHAHERLLGPMDMFQAATGRTVAALRLRATVIAVLAANRLARFTARRHLKEVFAHRHKRASSYLRGAPHRLRLPAETRCFVAGGLIVPFPEETVVAASGSADETERNRSTSGAFFLVEEDVLMPTVERLPAEPSQAAAYAAVTPSLMDAVTVPRAKDLTRNYSARLELPLHTKLHRGLAHLLMSATLADATPVTARGPSYGADTTPTSANTTATRDAGHPVAHGRGGSSRRRRATTVTDDASDACVVAAALASPGAPAAVAYPTPYTALFDHLDHEALAMSHRPRNRAMDRVAQGERGWTRAYRSGLPAPPPFGDGYGTAALPPRRQRKPAALSWEADDSTFTAEVLSVIEALDRKVSGALVQRPWE